MLSLRFKPIESYFDDIENISLELKSDDEEYTFIKHSEKERIIKIIRGFYSGYQWKVKIKDIQSASIWVIIIPVK